MKSFDGTTLVISLFGGGTVEGQGDRRNRGHLRSRGFGHATRDGLVYEEIELAAC